LKLDAQEDTWEENFALAKAGMSMAAKMAMMAMTTSNSIKVKASDVLSPDAGDSGCTSVSPFWVILRVLDR
jgi:hypothetical protein